MNNILTAEEFLCTKGVDDGDMILSTTIHDVRKAMIEFAKLHVEAALKAAAEKAYIDNNHQQGCSFDSDDFEVNKESILNAYPLDLIK